MYTVEFLSVSSIQGLTGVPWALTLALDSLKVVVSLEKMYGYIEEVCVPVSKTIQISDVPGQGRQQTQLPLPLLCFCDLCHVWVPGFLLFLSSTKRKSKKVWIHVSRGPST